MVMVLMVLGAWSGSASAANHRYGAANMTVWTPDNWTVKTGPVLRATPPRKGAFVNFEVTRFGDLKTASSNLQKLVRKYVGKASAGAPRAARVGSYTAMTASGSGNMDGMAVVFQAYLYQVGSKVVLGIGLAPKPVYGRHSGTMGRVLTSVR